MNNLQSVLIAYGNIYSLSDIHNMFDSCDIKFDYFNIPYVIVDNRSIKLDKDALSFITPISVISNTL